ncbi:MAG: hypothetical protein JWO59_2235 [Chloroflexi bacterium]|nr:hypothetical protein [Chloroflexota bacterium]
MINVICGLIFKQNLEMDYDAASSVLVDWNKQYCSGIGP